MITRLIGAPVEHTDDFRQWAHDRIALLGSAPSLSEDERATIALRLIRFSGWLRDFVESRRKAPRDDLASALIAATSDDGSPALSTSEIVNLIGTILSAGSSTTVNFIPLFIRLLLSHPGQLALILGEEFARWGQNYFALTAGAPPLTAEQERDLVARARRMTAWLHDSVQARRAAPRDDFISALITATTAEGDPATSRNGCPT